MIVKHRLECKGLQSLFRCWGPGGRRSEMDLRIFDVIALQYDVTNISENVSNDVFPVNL